MKFYGTPNMGVYERPKAYSFKKKKGITKKKLIFRFDNNGEFETADTALIEKLVKKFKHEKAEEKDVEKKVLKCKQCGFETTESMGKLLAHIRKEHPKE